MRILFGFTLACVVSSCAWTDHSPENGWYEENFDNLNHWKKDAVISSNQWRSGMYATYADSAHPVSESFTMHFNEVRFHHYTGVKATAWVFNPSNDTSGQVVLEVVDMRSGEPERVLAEHVILGTDFRAVNSWGKVQLKLDFPTLPGPHQVLRFYLASLNCRKSYMDDVTLEFQRELIHR